MKPSQAQRKYLLLTRMIAVIRDKYIGGSGKLMVTSQYQGLVETTAHEDVAIVRISIAVFQKG